MTETAWDALLASWQRSLAARNLSPETIKLYRRSVRGLGQHLGWPDPTTVTRGQVEDYIGRLIAGTSPQTAAIRFRSLRVWFGWLIDEDEIDTSPMAKMAAPRVDEKLVPVVPVDDLKRLLATVSSGKDFVDRRDHALLRILIDCGLRLGEITGLRLVDVDLDTGVLYIGRTKTRRGRAVAFGQRTAVALDRYLRARARHPQAHLDPLWIGGRGKGALTSSGVGQVVKRRCIEAGLPPINPHRFRHTAAHYWLAGGGTEGDAMQTFGWVNRTMIDRYGASAAASRARDAARKLSLGDRL